MALKMACLVWRQRKVWMGSGTASSAGPLSDGFVFFILEPISASVSAAEIQIPTRARVRPTRVAHSVSAGKDT